MGTKAEPGTPAVSEDVLVEADGLSLPLMGFSDPTERADRTDLLAPEPPRPGGGEPMPRPDTDRAGRGGANQTSALALNLADRDEGLTLTREVQSRNDRDQVERLKTAQDRASYDDRRTTTHPMELTFLASGKGARQERRTPAPTDPSSGVLFAATAAVPGSVLGAEPLPTSGSEPERDRGGSVRGAAHRSPGKGVLDGNPGQDHRASAHVAHARPMLPRAAPSVPAEVTGNVRDDQESEQEVEETEQSIVHASTAGGRLGEGPGGEELRAQSRGSGGIAGEGSEARPLGGGSGPLFALDSDDPRLSLYTRAMLVKLDREPLWQKAFPHEAALEGMQGIAIVSVVVANDGTVREVALARPSGIPAFDENVRMAVRRAAPFAPLPPAWHAASARVTIAYDATNPAVR